MRSSTPLIAAVAVAGTFGLAACDVKKTQEGNVTVPKYEVNQTQKGDVTLPKYDVTPPSVDVKQKEVEVGVPKVVVEKETVTVPSIDVKTGDERAAAEKKR